MSTLSIAQYFGYSSWTQMRDVVWVSFERVDWRDIEHMASSNIGIRILKCECAVWPHYNSSPTIPLARATLLTEWTVDRNWSIYEE